MRIFPVAALLVLLVSSQAFAKSAGDHVAVGRDVTVAEDESANDIVCVFCSVHVHGAVRGDIVTLFGEIDVDEGQRVSGDVLALGGDLRLGEGASVGGDVSVMAGDARLADGAEIHGDRNVLPGRFWMLLPVAPLLIVIGFVWLLIWSVSRLLQRNRYAGYPAPQPYRNGPPRL